MIRRNGDIDVLKERWNVEEKKTFVPTVVKRFKGVRLNDELLDDLTLGNVFLVGLSPRASRVC